MSAKTLSCVKVQLIRTLALCAPNMVTELISKPRWYKLVAIFSVNLWRKGSFIS